MAKSLRSLAKDLSPNQLLFCHEWLIDRNGTRAYRKTHPNCNTDGAASVESSKNLANPKVKAYIWAELQARANAADLKAEKVLREDSSIAFSDLREIFSGWTMVAPSELPDSIAPALAGIEIKEVADLEGNVTTTYKYKLWDKGKSLDRLGKYLGIYKDKVEIEGLEDLASRLAKAHERIDGVEGQDANTE